MKTWGELSSGWRNLGEMSMKNNKKVDHILQTMFQVGVSRHMFLQGYSQINFTSV